MWYKRDFSKSIPENLLPVKILKGPRQVGKTSILEKLNSYSIVYMDDPALRRSAQSNPRTFLDQHPDRLIIDEAARAPELFLEIKRRVDERRRLKKTAIDYWLTGSNQTLLRKNVSESLAGRANYFDLNTLSLHELQSFQLGEHCMRGGWPELRANPKLDFIRYLNDLITSFIERDIVAAAGIEKFAAFTRALEFNSGRIGQIYVASEIAQLVSVDITTIQSWNNLLKVNGLIEIVPAFHNNINKRLIKSPKIYFQDVSLAVRLQGWSEFRPLFTSPQIGHVFENIVFSEIHRFFINRCGLAKIFHLRSKEKVEIDFLIELPNQKYIAIEAKLSPKEFSPPQLRLLDSLNLNIVGKLCVSATQKVPLASCDSILVQDLWDTMSEYG